MKTRHISFLLFTMLCLASCEKSMIEPAYADTPAGNFECLWQNYDLYYGQFLTRQIDWDSLYLTYRPRINNTMTHAELADLFKSLIGNFHDDHVFIEPTVPGLTRIESGRSDTMKVQSDFSLSCISQHYLTNAKKMGDHITYGFLAENLGYIHMDVFMDPLPFVQSSFDDMLHDLKDTRGIVFDIRKLEGGDDRLARFVAGRFTESAQLYMTSRKRNGPRHQDFEPEIQWFVNPEGESQYRKPVVLLTGRFTASAGETFTLAMKKAGNVVQMGDTTLGAFSDIMTMELPNGWLHTVPVGDYRTSEGISLEGIGIAPDFYVKSTKAGLEAGVDAALEKAMEYLRSR